LLSLTCWRLDTLVSCDLGGPLVPNSGSWVQPMCYCLSVHECIYFLANQNH